MSESEAAEALVRLAGLLRRSVRPSGLPWRTVAVRFADVAVTWDSETGEVRTTDRRN